MPLFGWLRRFFRKGALPLDIPRVEAALKYHFYDPEYLYTSLKHRSYSQAVDGTTELSNERLEFLGDSVLNMVITHHVFIEHPEFQEGDLTKLKSSLVNKQTAHLAARKVGLEQFILLNSSEENAGGRNRASILADTYEAVIGAIFLDGGIEAARSFIRRSILDDPAILSIGDQPNYKSLLLERVQGERLGHPLYRTVAETGPDHDKVFAVEVQVNGTTIGSGAGKNKKTAQQEAAREGLLNIWRLR